MHNTLVPVCLESRALAPTYSVSVVLLHERRHLVVAAAHDQSSPRHHDVIGDGGRSGVGELRAARRVRRDGRRGHGRRRCSVVLLQMAAADGESSPSVLMATIMFRVFTHAAKL